MTSATERLRLGIDDIYEVAIVVNGAVEMSSGKLAGQALQAAIRWRGQLGDHYAFIDTVEARDESKRIYASFGEWVAEGTRTIVKVATTEAMWKRACELPDAYVMVDEGFTEVEAGTATVCVIGPYKHKDRPQLLKNKKIPLL